LTSPAVATEKPNRADLRRFLNGQTVLAHPPTALYQLRKLVRRHRAAFAIGAAVAGIVLAAAVVSTALAVRLADQRDELAAAQAREREHRQRVQVEANKLRATYAFLLAMLTADDPGGAFPPDVELRHLVDGAVRSLDGGVLRDQPAVEAGIRTTLARVYLSLGLAQKAEAQARRAFESRAADPGPGTPEYAEALSVLASALHESGRYDESEWLRRESLALHRRLYGDESPEALRQMHSLVSVLRDQRELVEAEHLAREALDLAIRRSGERSLETAEARLRLGWVLEYVDVRESEEQIREALAIREAHRGRDDPLVAQCLLRMGRTLHAAGDSEGAKAALYEGLGISRARLGDKHPGTLRYMNYLVSLLESGREYETAEDVCRQMLEGWRSYPGVYPERVAGATASLARIRAGRGDVAGAEELHRRALQELRDLVGEGHPATARQWSALAGFLAQQDRLAEAEATLNEALSSQRAALGDQHELVADTLDQLARVLERQGRLEECERAKARAVEIMRAVHGDTNETVVRLVGQLAAGIAARGGPGAPGRAAAVLAEHAGRLRHELEAVRGAPGELRVAIALAMTLRALARTWCDAGEFNSCEDAARQAIAAVSPKSHSRTERTAWADGHYWLGAALLGRRAYAEAETALLQCHQTYGELGAAGRWPTPLKELLVRLYEEWEASQPGRGHAASAARWRAELDGDP
jgi:tetratricopeptide (TPR) repeat protein